MNGVHVPEAIPPFLVTLRRKGYVQRGPIRRQLLMQISEVIVALLNRPRKRSMGELHCVPWNGNG